MGPPLSSTSSPAGIPGRTGAGASGPTGGSGALTESCAICDGGLDGEPTKCPTCGFPTVLLPEAKEAIAEEDKERKAAIGAAATAPLAMSIVLPFPEVAQSPPPPNAGALTAEQTAIALQASMRVAQLLGMDTTEVGAALTSAAMSVARGGLAEAQKVLQDAYDKLEPETTQRFEALAVSLEEQEGRLREEGIAADVAREISRSRRAFDEGARIEAVEALQKAAKGLGELESAWKTVKETLLRIDTLREVGKRLGMDLTKVDERLVEVRKTLSEENLSAAALNDAGTQAGAALVLLHEQVRNQIALLGQEAIRSLKAHPPPPSEREKAETRLKQVLAHARAGRLKEASEEMVSFRHQFLGIAPEPAEGGAAATPAATPATAVAAPAAAAAAAAETAPSPPSTTEPSATPVETPKAEVGAPPTPSVAPERPSGVATPSPPAKEEPLAEEPPAPKAAPSTPAARSVSDIVAEARTLGAKMKEQQKRKKDVKRSANLLKEVTDLVKAGKLPEADEKLSALRASLEEK
jgi:hypothetical protein